MASRRTSSRSPTRPRAGAGGRARSSRPTSDSSQTVVMIGAAAIAIVVILFVMMRGNGGDESGQGGSAPAAGSGSGAGPAAAQPAPEPGTAVAGKTPDRPAPELTSATLQRLDEILAEAKEHYNDGVRKRTAGDNLGARESQAKAKALLDEWEGLITDQLRWQEEAEMEDWAQPPAYELLTRKYAGFSRLQKSVRMGGGK